MNIYSQDTPIPAPALLGEPDYLSKRPEHHAAAMPADVFAHMSEVVGRVASGDVHLATQTEKESELRALVSQNIRGLITEEDLTRLRLLPPQVIFDPTEANGYDKVFDIWDFRERYFRNRLSSIVLSPTELAMVDSSAISKERPKSD
jgi:hypothetical protein